MSRNKKVQKAVLLVVLVGLATVLPASVAAKEVEISDTPNTCKFNDDRVTIESTASLQDCKKLSAKSITVKQGTDLGSTDLKAAKKVELGDGIEVSGKIKVESGSLITNKNVVLKEKVTVKKDIELGAGSKVSTKLKASEGSIVVGDNVVIEEKLKAKQDINLGASSEITGKVKANEGSVVTSENISIGDKLKAKQSIELGANSKVAGKTKANQESVVTGEDVLIDGKLKAKQNVDLGTGSEVTDKVKANQGSVVTGENVSIGDKLKAKQSIELGANSEVAGKAKANSGFLTAQNNVVVEGSVDAKENIELNENIKIAGDVNSGEGNISVGSNSTIGGGFDAQTGIEVGPDTTVNGDVDTDTRNVSLGERSTITGDVTTGTGDVILRPQSLIDADVDASSGTVYIAETAEITGDIDAQNIVVVDLSFFEVDLEDLSPNPVIAGGNITATYEVTNTGGFAGSQKVKFVVNGSVINSTTLSLEPSEAVEGQFTYQTDEGDVPDVAVRAVSQDESASIQLSVNDRPEAELQYMPARPNVSETVRFNASGTQDITGIQRYEWDIDDDGTFERTGSTVTHSFETAGNKTVSLRVTDDGNLTDTASVNVLVNDRPEVGFEYTPTEPNLENTVDFDAAATVDSIGGIESYVWSIDSSVTKTGAEIAYDFTQPGNHTVKLTVTDVYGLTNTTTKTVYLNRPPVANATRSGRQANVSKAITLDATASVDPDGTIASYEWDVDDDGTYEKTGATITQTYETSGTKAVSLRVTDDQGSSDRDSVSLIINDRPRARYEYQPTDPTLGEMVQFNASASADITGGIENYQWDIDDDGDFEKNGSTITHVFTGVNNQTVALRVTDAYGLRDTSTQTLDLNAPPIANASKSDRRGIVGDPVTLNGRASFDPDTTITSYEWDIDADGTYEKTGSVLNHTFGVPGNKSVSLRVTDDGNLTDTATVNVLVNDRPQVAFDYTPSVPNPNETVQFDATATEDVVGGITSYVWTIDGNTTQTGEQITQTFVKPGNHTVELTVTDSYGRENTTTETVYLNKPPVANASRSEQRGQVNESLTLNATASIDPDGSISSYEWDIDDDGTFERNGETVSQSFETPGNQTVTLRVTDNGNLSDTAAVNVLVNDPPRADFEYTPIDPNPGERVRFNASVTTDSIGGIESYNWTIDGNTTKTGETASHVFTSSGNHTVSLQITDGYGLEDTIIKTIHVNAPPIANASRSEQLANVSEAIMLDATASFDRDGSITSYEWDIDDDGTYEKNGATVSQSFETAGNLSVSLRVTDDGNLTDTTTVNVLVNDRPRAAFNFTPTTPNLEEPVQFNASVTQDAIGGISSYAWTIDGNTTRTGEQITQTFVQPGNHTVELTVTDAYGVANTTNTTLYLNAPPIANASRSDKLANVSEPVILNATASTDPDGTITSYEWDVDDDGSYEKNGSIVTQAYETLGNKTVSLRVTDDGNLTDTATINVLVNDRPQAAFEYTPTEPNQGETIVFNASTTTDSVGGVESYEWDIDGDGTYEKTGLTITHAFDSADSHTVTLRATDVGNLSDTDSTRIEINAPPTASINTSDSTVKVGNSISFEAVDVDDPDGTVETYAWDLDGDGDTDATGRSAERAYQSSGSYRISLTVTDNDGLSNTVTTGIGILPEQIDDSDPGIPEPPDDSRTGYSTGDPHLKTFDGRHYDFHAAGEYVYARAPNGTLSVQGRLKAYGRTDVSYNTGVATTLDGHNVSIDVADSTPLVVDGQHRKIARIGKISVGNGTIFRRGSRYTVVFPGQDGEVDKGDERLTAHLRGNIMDIYLILDGERDNAVEGLFGTVAADKPDVAFANGTTVSPTDYETFYGAYRAEWRVDSISESHFHYEEGESSDSFFDPDAPSSILTIEDLDAEKREAAEEVAKEAGLEPGTEAYENAVIDYAITDEEKYLASAAASRPTNASFSVGAGESFRVAPGKVPFFATVKDASAANVSFEWRFGTESQATGQRVSHTFNETGNYTATVTATGPNGGIAQDTVAVIVSENASSDRPPVPVLSTTRINETHLKLTVSDALGDLSGYAWDVDGDDDIESYEPTVIADRGDEDSTASVVLFDENGNRVVTTATVPARSNIGEVGETGTVEVSADNGQWQTVEFTNTYENPVVIPKPASNDDGAPATPRIRNVTNSSMEIQIEEWAYQDGEHGTETVHYVVMEAGTYEIGNGTAVDVGFVYTHERWDDERFDRKFNTTPIVFTSAQTYNDPAPIVTRNKEISPYGFTTKPQESEAGGNHGIETIGYIAIEPGAGSTEGKPFGVGRTPVGKNESWHQIEFNQSFSSDRTFIADLQKTESEDTAWTRFRSLDARSVEIQVEEEQSRDSETTHPDTVAGFWVFGSDGDIHRVITNES
jgi:PKD repeat protein/acetyltransferase-like isoleucine patch superfamily enzyme